MNDGPAPDGPTPTARATDDPASHGPGPNVRVPDDPAAGNPTSHGPGPNVRVPDDPATGTPASHGPGPNVRVPDDPATDDPASHGSGPNVRVPDDPAAGGPAPDTRTPPAPAHGAHVAGGLSTGRPAAGRPSHPATARALGALLTALRRIGTSAVVLALIPVAAALLIVVSVLGAPVSLAARGPWRPTRMVAFLVVYLLVDVAGVLAAIALFLRGPFVGAAARERRAADAFALLARLLAVLRGAADRLFRLEVDMTPPLPTAAQPLSASPAPADPTAGQPAPANPGTEQPTPSNPSPANSTAELRAAADSTAEQPAPGNPDGAPGVPLLVLVRHAGLGDSFLLLQMLLTEAGLLPHTVLKGVLRADPCLDVLLGRVPHCFLPPAHGTAEDAVAALAAGLRPRDALVIFPEGGNFTPRRHHRAIARLRSLGQYRRAARAARLRYVLPPRDGGSLAALAAAPTADVVFVAHAGLDVIASPRAAWSFLPFRRPVRVHWWRIPAAEIPAGDAARSEWLLAQWERLDRWTAEQAVPATPHV